MRVVLIPTHVGRGLRPEIIVRQFPPKVRTYLKSTTGNFLVPARTNIAVKLLKDHYKNDCSQYELIISYGVQLSIFVICNSYYSYID